MLHNLRRLALAVNNLTGSVPASLGNLQNLQYLSLFTNSLQGKLPVSLGNCSALSVLALYENQLSGNVPESLGKLHRLEYLSLWGNVLSGGIPESLGNCSSLTLVELSTTGVSGKVPESLGKLQRLEELFLWGNLLSGGIPVALGNCSSLSLLNLAWNILSGSIPVSVGQLKHLEKLYVDHNNLGGVVPENIGNLSRLSSLHLQVNRFVGSIPSTVGKLGSLQRMFLGSNSFSGAVPEELAACKFLGILSLDSNKLGGIVPPKLGQLVWLTNLNLSNNMLTGRIPSTLWNLFRLQELYLSQNMLTGNIPAGLANLRGLEFTLDLSQNRLYGPIPLEIGVLDKVQIIDLSSNAFSREIPSTLSKCNALTELNLSRNQLDGTIPASLVNVRNLVDLDISSNHLTGPIPSILSDLSNLSFANFSFNNLSGSVPSGGVFTRLSYASFLGNRELCGAILHKECGTLRHPRASSKFPTLAVALSTGIGTTLLLVGIIWWMIRPKKPEDAEYSAHFPLKLSEAELAEATNNYSDENIIGVGGLSKVYRGQLEDGRVVAVKRLRLDLNADSALRHFLAEWHTLGKVRHRNLVKILSYCCNLETRALVLEFMPGGSLDKHLHGDTSRHLNWNMCLNVALDVAQAMAYLHHDHQQPLVHCDLKPSNILFDADNNAHVADFGIAKFIGLDAKEDTSTSTLKGSIGYIAPEYAYIRRASPKCDVFSYGIMLLEMITRRRPTDDAVTHNGLSLRSWVRAAFPQGTLQLVDSTLLASTSSDAHDIDSPSIVQAQILELMGIAMICTEENPEARPSMQDVLRMVAYIKKRNGGAEGSSSILPIERLLEAEQSQQMLSTAPTSSSSTS